METNIKKIELNFNDLINFNLPLNSTFELIIHLNNVKYEFRINIKENCDKLLVLGSGAVPIEQIKRFKDKPYYNRLTWNFNVSTIYFNDPTRYLNNELQGGWGIGIEEDWYLKNIKDIILKISQKCNIINENILFFGSSMGGFMALFLATMVKQSKALVDIPQLNMNIYMEKHWNNIKKFSFNNKSDDYVLKNYSHRINIIDMIKKENYIPDATLILNYSHLFDIKQQYAYFFGEELNKINFTENSNFIKVIIHGKIKGHAPLSNEETYKLINFVFNKKSINDWMENLNEYRYPKTTVSSKQVNLLNKYLTARIDIKNYGVINNTVEIIKNSDMESTIDYPSWFSDQNGKGVVLNSYAESINLLIKCYNDGELLIKFMGVDYRNKENQRLPIYIKYTNIYVNNENVNEHERIACHDQPLIFKKKVKDGEIISLNVSWTSI